MSAGSRGGRTRWAPAGARRPLPPIYIYAFMYTEASACWSETTSPSYIYIYAYTGPPPAGAKAPLPPTYIYVYTGPPPAGAKPPPSSSQTRGTARASHSACAIGVLDRETRERATIVVRGGSTTPESTSVLAYNLWSKNSRRTTPRQTTHQRHNMYVCGSLSTAQRRAVH